MLEIRVFGVRDSTGCYFGAEARMGEVVAISSAYDIRLAFDSVIEAYGFEMAARKRLCPYCDKPQGHNADCMCWCHANPDALKPQDSQ